MEIITIIIAILLIVVVIKIMNAVLKIAFGLLLLGFIVAVCHLYFNGGISVDNAQVIWQSLKG